MKKKFKLSFELPELVKKYKTVSPSELQKLVLQDFNVDTTAESITMFFKRHPQETQLLKDYLTQNVASQIVVSADLFKNGNFFEVPLIKKWGNEKATRVSADYHTGNVNSIKSICQGVYYLKDRHTHKLTEVHIDGWEPKSPERLTLEQVQEYLAVIHKAGTGTKQYRIAARDFFLSRDGRTMKPTEISGDMPKIGKWKHAVATKKEIADILQYVKERNFRAFVADLFMYKTGTRSRATFSEVLKTNFHCVEGVNIVSIMDKGFHRKGRKQWDKIIPDDLKADLELLWELNNNPFEDLEDKARELNKEAYRAILQPNSPELDLALMEPNHFWRHMFAQHMLRETNWNYDAVAFLGGWDGTDMLKKVYGAPPIEMLRALGLQFIPKL